MDYLFIAVTLGVLACLADRVWEPPFKPYYGFRAVLFIIIIVLAVMKLAGHGG